MRAKKRGQLTIFIILGIILLLAVAAVFYVQSRIRENQQGPQVKEVVTDVPEALKPVQNYVEQCLKDTTLKGFKELGLHGGYIDMRDTALTGYYTDATINSRPLSVQKRSTSIVNDIETKPYLNDAFLMFPDNPETEVAFWYHFDRYGEESVSIPDNIEAQVERFIVRDITACLDSFKGLEENRGLNITLIDPAQVKASVIVTNSTEESFIDVRLTYPMRIQTGNSETVLKDFRATVDIDFAKIRDLAVMITEQEGITNFVEDIILQSLSGYQYIGSYGEKTLPPIAEVDEKPYPKTWVLPKTKEYARDFILPESFQRVTFSGTHLAENINARFSDPQKALWTGTYGEMLVKLPIEDTDERYRNLRVELFFPRSDIYFDITPRSGPIIRPRTERQPGLLFFEGSTTNYYQFFYDVSLPVYVMITELNDDTDMQYKFIFGLEGNVIRNSKIGDILDGYGTLPPLDAIANLSVGVDKEAYDSPLGPGHVETSCEELPADSRPETCPPIPEPPLPGDAEFVFEGTLFSDPAQYKGNNISFSVIDGESHAPLDLSDARVIYYCGILEAELENVAISGSPGTFTSPVPICFGDDMLVVEKPGYSGWLFDEVGATPENFDSDHRTTKYLTPSVALLYKEKEVTINADIIDAEKVRANAGGELGRPFRPSQKMTLTFTRYPYHQQGPDAMNKVLRGSSEIFSIDYLPNQPVKVNMTPGYYAFEGMVTDDDPQVQLTEWCTTVLFQEQCYPSPPITRQTLEQDGPLRDFPVGGITMTNIEPVFIEPGHLSGPDPRMTIHTIGITRPFMLKSPEESYGEGPGYNSIDDATYYIEITQEQAHFLIPS